MRRNRKICFVALTAYPTLTNKNMGHTGGADVLQTLLGRELVKHDFKVIFIVYDSVSGIENIDGIEIIKIRNGKMSKISKALLIWRAMKKADADIYYHHSGAQGIVSIFCWINKKKFVCHVSSDRYLTKDDYLWNLDIKLASVIIVQSKFQKVLLNKYFYKSGILIRNFFPIPDEKSPSDKGELPIVLWVGRMDPVKQPHLFLELAKKIPQARFKMISGAINDKKIYESIKDSLKKIPNLEFLDFVPFYKIDYYFKQAAILVNTSKFEGYPNTFIQAWMNYTPVVSLSADPDDVICKYRLGFHSMTFERMVEDVEMLLRDKQLREEIGENARRFVEKEHNMNNIISKYIRLFQII